MYFRRCKVLLDSSAKNIIALLKHLCWKKHNVSRVSSSLMDIIQTQLLQQDCQMWSGSGPANQMHLPGGIAYSLVLCSVALIKGTLFRTGSWHLTSRLTELPCFCCTIFCFHSEHEQAVSAARFGLSAVRRSATSDLSDAHQRPGLKRVQCAEVHKSSRARMYGGWWREGLTAGEMAGEGSRGGGVREAGERGEGRRVSASSPVTPIR